MITAARCVSSASQLASTRRSRTSRLRTLALAPLLATVCAGCSHFGYVLGVVSNEAEWTPELTERLNARADEAHVHMIAFEAQAGVVDCGPALHRMLAAHFRGPETAAANVPPLGPDGWSIGELAEALRASELPSKATLLEPGDAESALRAGAVVVYVLSPFPGAAAHYSAVIGYTDTGRLIVLDPARGVISITPSMLAERTREFSHLALVVAP